MVEDNICSIPGHLCHFQPLQRFGFSVAGGFQPGGAITETCLNQHPPFNVDLPRKEG